ncbi:hypothetical protein [Paenibacillus thiaminolyticus]|uniref:hypothetical protein n=1 Tax=Paenibacillus thiaminolyticus TaxID=49283 RepID=UPI001C71F8B2|nr:hypothetical protein [Paenibacillus thiaminolyticus]
MLAHLPSLKRALLRANRGMFESTVNLPVAAFSETLEDVARKLHERWEQYKRAQSRA